MIEMENLAKQLWRARAEGRIIDGRLIRAPRIRDRAYAVQWEIVELSGCHSVGFKATTTSVEAQKMLGTNGPGSAALLGDYVYQSPSIVEVNPRQTPAVEGEFVFKLGEDLPARARDYTYGDVVGAIEAVAPGVDIVGTRIEGGLTALGHLLVLADGGVNIGLVHGSFTPFSSEMNLREAGVKVHVNNRIVACGEGARVLGDPVNVLVFIANQQSARGVGLKAGDIISTGTCTGLSPVAPGDQVSVDFGRFGQIEIGFTDGNAN